MFGPRHKKISIPTIGLILTVVLVGCQLASSTTTQPTISPSATSLPSAKTCNDTTLHGKVAVIGNDPFTYLVIRAQDGDDETVYQIIGNLKDDLWQHQGAIVQICGTVQPTTLAPMIDKDVVVFSYSIITP